MTLKPASWFTTAFLCLLPTAAFAGDPVKVATVEGITEYALDNGLQVLLFPDPSVQTVTVNVTYRVGSRHEGRGESGMAHLLEHMVFKGTPTHPNIWGALEDHGARFNGTTWVDRTNYFETLPASTENLEFALRMEADRMVNSTISGEELAREMTVVRNEFEMGENNPMGVLSERMMSAAFLWHNYGKSTIGNRSDIERVPVDKLRAFYRTYYQPDNATVVVAGQFDPEATLAMINRTFGVIPRPARTLDPTYTEEPAQDGPRAVTLKRTGDVAACGLIYHIPSALHPDFPAVSILTGVLTDRPSGRLYEAMITPGLATSVSGSAFAFAEPGVVEFMAEVRMDQDARKALEVMTAVVEGLGAKPITDEEVERIKAQQLKTIRLSLTSSGRIGVRLSEAIAQGDWKLFFLQRDRIKTVSSSEVQRVAQQYFIESNRTSGLFQPVADIRRAEIAAAPSAKTLVKDYRGSETIALGEAFDATPEHLDSRTRTVTLPSGIEVALINKETRGDAVRASFQFRFGDEAALTGHTTTLPLIPALMMRGTQKRSYQELRDEIDRLQSRIFVGGSGGGQGRRGGGSGGGAVGTVGAGIQSDRAHVVAAIELLGEILRQPAFDAAEFEKIRLERLAAMEQQLSDPRALGMNAMSRTLSPWPADSIHYVPTLEENIGRMRTVSLDGLKDLYGRFYGADRLRVAIVGDCDADQVLAAIERVFGTWKSGAPYARIAKPHRANQPDIVTIKTPDKEMAVIGMGATFALRDDHPDYPALRFAAYVLGQSAKSRIMTRLRHQDGLSYGAGAALQVDEHDERAALTATAICAPQNASRALAAMKEELQRWTADGLTAEEIVEARNSYALQMESNLANDQFVIGQLLEGMELGRSFAYHADLLRRIQALDAGQISQALQRHIGTLQFAEMSAGDFDRVVTPAPDEPVVETVPAAQGLPQRMSQFDTNNDGKLQKSEAPERMQQFFDRIDTNGDGAVDADEAAEMRSRGGERRRGGDGDGE